MWIKFANLCRKNERMILAKKTINSLLSTDGVSFLLLSNLVQRPEIFLAVAPGTSTHEGSSQRRLRSTEIYVGKWLQEG
jgi:hypothetical protein